MVIFSGTHRDVEVLRHFFENTLHFEVNEAHDLTYDDLIKTFEAVKRRLNDVIAKDNIYCFLCAILSHGNLVSMERGIALSVRQIFKMHKKINILATGGGGGIHGALDRRPLLMKSGSRVKDFGRLLHAPPPGGQNIDMCITLSANLTRVVFVHQY